MREMKSQHLLTSSCTWEDIMFSLLNLHFKKGDLTIKSSQTVKGKKSTCACERKTGRDHEKGRERERRKRTARKTGRVKETSEFGVEAPKLNTNPFF